MRLLSRTIIFIAAALLLGGCGYNSLQIKEEQVFKAWADVESTLQRRADLIPNLVATVKGYAAHEKETLEAVIKARNAAASSLDTAKADPANAQAIKELGQSEGALASALGRLFALSEAYPDLKANENMMQFQEELASTENKVAFARQAFNDSVLAYNNSADFEWVQEVPITLPDCMTILDTVAADHRWCGWLWPW